MVDVDVNDDKPKNRNRTALLYVEEDEKPIKKFDKKIDREKEQQQQQKKKTSDKTNTMNTSSKNFNDFLGNDDADESASSSNTKQKSPTKKLSKKNSNSKYSPVVSTAPKRPSSPRNDNYLSRSQSNGNDTDTIKRPKIEKKPEKKKVYRPFNKLLSDVVFAISGIQNPLRAELRQKALELGAKYKPDWDNSCTHLM